MKIIFVDHHGSQIGLSFKYEDIVNHSKLDGFEVSINRGDIVSSPYNQLQYLVSDISFHDNFISIEVKPYEQIENKFENHPYNSDYAILDAVFSGLQKKQEHNWHILRGYKTNSETMDQINYEDSRILQVKELILKLYEQHLKEIKD